MTAIWLSRFSRVGRYMFVGGGVTLAYSLLMAGLYKTQIVDDPTLASAIAFVLNQPLAFFAHRRFTYGDIPQDTRQAWRFAIFALSGFVLVTGSMKLVDAQRWPFWIGLMLGWVIVPLANYVIASLWVFKTGRLLGADGRRVDT